MYENNVVVLHNVNAFGETRNEPPKWEAVFYFSRDDFDTDDLHGGMQHAEKVFAICNGAVEDPLVEEYYGKGNRSLSVSDVVFVNGVYWQCNPWGWQRLDKAPPS